MNPEPRFDVVLRGYHRRGVDALVGRVRPALRTDDRSVRAAALQALAAPGLAVTLRGYDRRQVDAFLAEARDALQHSAAG